VLRRRDHGPLDMGALHPTGFARMNRPYAKYDRIAFLASPAPEAQKAREALAGRYGHAAPDEADVVVALGGDGFMLQTLHALMPSGKPIYGMHRGTVGFLMNEYTEDRLHERLATAGTAVIHPLVMRARDADGREHQHRAFNEVSLFRQINQAAWLRILIDGVERLSELVADGLLVATPAGSTAYNLSVQGPIIPIDAPLLALTPISPFRPRRWRGGVLLHDTVRITVEVLDAEKRPVAAVADHDEVRSVRSVDIAMDHQTRMNLLFDPGHNLDERILREQFGMDGR
jgi:NAD+ kinase